MLNKFAIFVALGFGSGLLRPAPGTWGSLAACAIAYALFYIGGALAVLVAAVAACLVGVWAAERYGQITGTSDASQVVIDEFAGQWIALLPVVYLVPNAWIYWVAAFGLFRVFDVLKPGPIGVLDRQLKGGLGVMADDIVAGGTASIILYGVIVYVA